MADLVERLASEDGLFYALGTSAMIFAAWLVVNFQAMPVVFFAYALILIIAMVYRYMEKSPYFESHSLFSSKPLIDIAIGLGFAALWYFVFLPSPYGILPLPPLPAQVLAIGPAAFLIVVLLAPVAEEYFFRGSIMPQIEEIASRRIGQYAWLIAIIAQAALFTAFHWQAYLTGALSSALIASFIFGIYVGAIAHWRKSIIPGIIIHAIINLAIVSPQFVIVAGL